MEMYLINVPCSRCGTTSYVFIPHKDATLDGKEVPVCDDCAPLILKPEYRG